MVDSFTTIYHKVIEFEKEGKEFSKIFQIKANKNSEKQKIIYTHPIKAFLDHNKGIFKIPNIYDLFT